MSCRSACSFLTLLLLLLMAATSQAQGVYKYGSEFLAGGVGARALGMGGAYVALAQDVTAGYWNPSGLSGLNYPQGAFMHVERFAKTVSYDYASVALPVNARSTVGVSFFRLGVDDIPNTLNAWDAERDQPLPRAEDYITRFSYAHYAFFVTYARALSENLTLGVTGKIIRGSIGDFAGSWGYSFDLGAQYRTGRFQFGITMQDVSTMLQSWSVNQEAVAPIGSTYNLPVPEGGTELVLPVARLGAGYLVPLGDFGFTVGADLDLKFDGQRSYYYNLGDISFHPRLGGELAYKGVVALRAGVSEVYNSERYGLQVTPSVGVGLNIQQVSLDYGFGDFSGFAADLGYSHRISLQFTLEQPGLARNK